jgi:hypothetical protein
MWMGMKEPYIEDLASHGGPEPCVGDPRGRSEALDRGRCGPGYRATKSGDSGCRRRSTRRKAISLAALSRAGSEPRVVEEPEHAPNLHARDPGEPTVARRRDGVAGRSGKAKVVIPR